MLKLIHIILFLFASNLIAQNLATNVIVESLDEQFSSSNTTVLRVRILNEGTQSLKGVKLSYFLNTASNKPIQADIYYAPGVQVQVVKESEQTHRIDLTLDNLPPGYFPNSSGLCIGIHNTDWSTRFKTDDFSQPNSNSFTKTSKIPVYIDGSLYSGFTPDLSKAAINDLEFIAFAPETNGNNSAWVEIKNQGQANVQMAQLKIGTQNERMHAIGNFALPSQSTLRIEFGFGASCMDLDFSDLKGCVSNAQLSPTANGELILKVNSDIISYVPWGQTGVNANIAISQYKWQDANDYVVTNGEKIGWGKTYLKGSIFTKKDGTRGINSNDWIMYREEEKVLLEQGFLPTPTILSPPNNVEVSTENGEPVVLAWNPVAGAQSYQVTVTKQADNSVVDQQVTDKTSVKVVLNENGAYQWSVLASEKPKERMVGYWPAIAAGVVFVAAVAGVIVYLNSDDWDTKSLNVQVKKARKDTELLDQNWKNRILISKWDTSHVDDLSFDEESDSRCWAAGVNMLNQYYGGDLTQDEIVLNGLGTFKHVGGTLDNTSIQYVVEWALSLDKFSSPWSSSLSKDRIESSINEKKPLFVVQNNPDLEADHMMVIDSYRSNNDGVFQARFLNIDNDGGIEWRTINQELLNFLYNWMAPIPKNGQLVKKTDPLVHIDSDDDGIKDFDEIYRFGTKYDNRDTDSDGVDDKTEMVSYLLNAPYYDYPLYRTISDFGDIDGDGLMAEFDYDSDNGGLSDGFEDKNRNGNVDPGETNPYDASDDTGIAIPNNWAIYTLNKLKINDGVKCLNIYGSGCRVGARGSVDPYSVILGVRAEVGRIETYGNVLLRNSSLVSGSVLAYQFVEYQNGAVVKGSVYQNYAVNMGKNILAGGILPSFPNGYAFESYETPNGTIVVKNGQKSTLVNTEKYSTVKVESGGHLELASGELFVGNLQLESGSIISKTNINEMTTLHVNGSVIWRPSLGVVDPLLFAKNFTLAQHSNGSMYMEGVWAGTLLAPKSLVVLGQANKKIYGRVLGLDIVVHQYSIFQQVNLAAH